jgi:hypothetical protein
MQYYDFVPQKYHIDIAIAGQSLVPMMQNTRNNLKRNECCILLPSQMIAFKLKPLYV